MQTHNRVSLLYPGQRYKFLSEDEKHFVNRTLQNDPNRKKYH